MDNKGSASDSAKTKKALPNNLSSQDHGDDSSQEPSCNSTQFYKEDRNTKQFSRVTRKEFLSESSSSTGSSESFGCIHGPAGKQYTGKSLVKRKYVKCLDEVPEDPKWEESCVVTITWDIANKLEFLLKDPVGRLLKRFDDTLNDFIQIALNGYYLVEDRKKRKSLKSIIDQLLISASKSILMDSESDSTKYFANLQNYFGNIGVLLLTLEDDDQFELLCEALLWHLSSSDALRGRGTVRRRHILAAAAPVLMQSVSRMIGLSSPRRYRRYVEIALIISCYSNQNCLTLIEENIIEHILYRFNPYFPVRDLPTYEIGPSNTEHYTVKLGESTIHSSVVFSLLLVLLKRAKEHLELHPKTVFRLPDEYSLQCFAWAFRYECKARDHHHERITMTSIATALVHCYGKRLNALANALMAALWETGQSDEPLATLLLGIYEVVMNCYIDVMSLSVLTEIPFRQGWMKKVSFNTGQVDVHFKKVLIYLSVDFIKTFPHNRFMIESRYWFLGLIYLLDPALSSLRARWSPPLYDEIRLAVLKALVCSFPTVLPKLIKEYGFIRRLMWYLEWYSAHPYELSLLYWFLRVLQSATRRRKTEERSVAVKDLFETHGVIVITHLCNTLVYQQSIRTEKAQAIISLILRLLTSVLELETQVTCSVYTYITWPECVRTLGINMLYLLVSSLEKNCIISDRWMVALMNFIWEGIVWSKANRDDFISSNGIFKLLDLISMTRDPVQCIALALLCDLIKGSEAIAQVITWRCKIQAANANANFIKRGSTISTLLALIFKDECKMKGVNLTANGLIEDDENPLSTMEVRKVITRKYPREIFSPRTYVCLSASDIAGSRMSKVYALLSLLSEDLEYKVSLADEAYKMYKNIELSCDDEVILVLSIHYLTMKLQEAWYESLYLNGELAFPDDEEALKEFLQLGRGWALELKKQQNQVIERHGRKEKDKEASLYSFLARVRLNIALDALRDVRAMARTSDRDNLTHCLLHDAVKAHHRRSMVAQKMDVPILRTYRPRLDDQNKIDQNIKIYHSNSPT